MMVSTTEASMRMGIWMDSTDMWDGNFKKQTNKQKQNKTLGDWLDTGA